MNTFNIPKETQTWLMIEGCEYNKRQRKLAEYLKSILPNGNSSDLDFGSNSLTILLLAS